MIFFAKTSTDVFFENTQRRRNRWRMWHGGCGSLPRVKPWRVGDDVRDWVKTTFTAHAGRAFNAVATTDWRPTLQGRPVLCDAMA